MKRVNRKEIVGQKDGTQTSFFPGEITFSLMLYSTILDSLKT